MSEITKESRADRAIACHNKGYNCAQSVAFAFLDKVDIDPETLFKVTEGLGLGMGGMEGTCGAISAAAVLAGLKISTADFLVDRKSTRLNSSHVKRYRMPSSA